MNFVFQNAFYRHVCHRSLFEIHLQKSNYIGCYHTQRWLRVDISLKISVRHLH